MPNTNLENLKPELEAIDPADIVSPDIPIPVKDGTTAGLSVDSQKPRHF